MPLVGGYLFLSTWNFTKYKAYRATGYRLFFQSAFVGFLLLIVAKLIVKILLFCSSMYLIMISEWIIPTGFNLESMAALIIGVMFPYLLNPFFSKRKFARVAAKDRGDSLHLMIYQAIENDQPIELTMQNGKVYIGLVSITGGFVNECAIVTPYFSGYREEKTNVLVITNNYQDVLAEMMKSGIKIKRSDLNVTLNMSDVATAKVFHPEVYVELEKLSRR